MNHSTVRLGNGSSMRGHRTPLRESLAIKTDSRQALYAGIPLPPGFSGVVGRVALAVTGDQFEECGALFDAALGVEAVRREGKLRVRAAG